MRQISGFSFSGYPLTVAGAATNRSWCLYRVPFSLSGRTRKDHYTTVIRRVDVQVNGQLPRRDGLEIGGDGIAIFGCQARHVLLHLDHGATGTVEIRRETRFQIAGDIGLRPCAYGL